MTHVQNIRFRGSPHRPRNVQELTGKDGIHTPLTKQRTEAALKAELEALLAGEEAPNRKNGATKKTIKLPSGCIELETPQDSAGSFELKFISLFDLGVSYQDIASHVAVLYGLGVSNATISAVTDKLSPELEQWRYSPLQSHYLFVWLEAIHYKVKDNVRYVSKAVYTVPGLNLEEKKKILGLYMSETEGANFWLSVVTDLNNSGVEDILIAAVDGLKGFPETINAIFLCIEDQLCIINQIPNSMKDLASKNQKAFMADLKPVYKAVSNQATESALNRLETRWGAQYPIVIKSWRSKWENLSVHFKYFTDTSRVIYTTNAIEAVHRQFRKLIKTKGPFPNENSLLNLLYVGIQNA